MNEPEFPVSTTPVDPGAQPEGSERPDNALAPGDDLERAFCAAVELAFGRGLAPGDLWIAAGHQPQIDESPDASTEPSNSVESPPLRLEVLSNLPQPVAALEALLAHPVIIARTRSISGSSPSGRPDGRAITLISDPVARNEIPAIQSAGSTAGARPRVGLAAAGYAISGFTDTREPAKGAVVAACCDLACSGIRPLLVVNHVPGQPSAEAPAPRSAEDYRQGVASACRLLGIQLLECPPTVAARAAIVAAAPATELDLVRPRSFRDQGDAILLLGNPLDPADPLQGLGGSLWLEQVHGKASGSAPSCDLDAAVGLLDALLALAHGGSIKSAATCREGGLAVALAECCFANPLRPGQPGDVGASVDLAALIPTGNESQHPAIRADSLLFAEYPGRVLVTTSDLDAGKVLAQAKILGVQAVRLGVVTEAQLVIHTPSGEFKWGPPGESTGGETTGPSAAG